MCYEKQENWGGLWRYNWRVGLDEHGEYVHNSQYKQLWSNGPKEASLEFPEYTYEDHFGRPVGSFPPRDVIFDYLSARWNKSNLRPFVCFNRVVKSVTFDPKTDKFSVSVKDMAMNVVLPAQEFDYVVNCTGHFSVPNVPKFEGMETFTGRIMHSHDFRSAVEFKGKE